MDEPTQIVKQLTGMLVPIVAMMLPVAIVWLAFRFRERRQQHTEDTVRRLLEQGLVVPPELFALERPKTWPHAQLRSGLILIGAGVGIIPCFLVSGWSAWGIGIIPLCIGTAQLIAWQVERQIDATNPQA